MIIPVRCFTCGQVIADKYHKYRDLLDTGYSEKDAMTALGLQRYCCRRMFLTYVDFTEMLLRFNAADNPIDATQGQN
jgi:DNA-directed RNA polymerase I, II, and III subunit RPABC5